MIHSLVEADPCPSTPTVADDDRHTAVLEVHALTAAVVSLRRQADHRHVARLNAYVDGLGHRTIHVELAPHDYERAAATLHGPGTLVRCSGILRVQGSRLCLLRPQGLELLEPEVDDAG